MKVGIMIRRKRRMRLLLTFLPALLVLCALKPSKAEEIDANRDVDKDIQAEMSSVEEHKSLEQVQRAQVEDKDEVHDVETVQDTADAGRSNDIDHDRISQPEQSLSINNLPNMDQIESNSELNPEQIVEDSLKTEAIPKSDSLKLNVLREADSNSKDRVKLDANPFLPSSIENYKRFEGRSKTSDLNTMDEILDDKYYKDNEIVNPRLGLGYGALSSDRASEPGNYGADSLNNRLLHLDDSDSLFDSSLKDGFGGPSVSNKGGSLHDRPYVTDSLLANSYGGKLHYSLKDSNDDNAMLLSKLAKNTIPGDSYQELLSKDHSPDGRLTEHDQVHFPIESNQLVRDRNLGVDESKFQKYGSGTHTKENIETKGKYLDVAGDYSRNEKDENQVDSERTLVHHGVDVHDFPNYPIHNEGNKASLDEEPIEHHNPNKAFLAHSTSASEYRVKYKELRNDIDQPEGHAKYDINSINSKQAYAQNIAQEKGIGGLEEPLQKVSKDKKIIHKGPKSKYDMKGNSRSNMDDDELEKTILDLELYSKSALDEVKDKVSPKVKAELLKENVQNKEISSAGGSIDQSIYDQLKYQDSAPLDSNLPIGNNFNGASNMDQNDIGPVNTLPKSDENVLSASGMGDQNTDSKTAMLHKDTMKETGIENAAPLQTKADTNEAKSESDNEIDWNGSKKFEHEEEKSSTVIKPGISEAVVKASPSGASAHLGLAGVSERETENIQKAMVDTFVKNDDVIEKALKSAAKQHDNQLLRNLLNVAIDASEKSIDILKDYTEKNSDDQDSLTTLTEKAKAKHSYGKSNLIFKKSLDISDLNKHHVSKRANKPVVKVVDVKLPTKKERKNLLKYHNDYRKLEQASNMRFVEWSDSLSKIAAEYISGCKWGHGQPHNYKARFNLPKDWYNIGQNLAFHTDMSMNKDEFGEFSMNQFYIEKNYLNMRTMECQKGKMCGHFIQVTWADVQQVGCAVARCPYLLSIDGSKRDPDREGWYLACNYWTPINLGKNGRILPPYVKNGPPCARCPEDASWCYQGLCRSKSSCDDAEATCECLRECRNCAKFNEDQCLCQCREGFMGLDCSEKCENKKKMCGRSPGFPPFWCNDERPWMFKVCPKMCQMCKASEFGKCNNPDKVIARPYVTSNGQKKPIQVPDTNSLNIDVRKKGSAGSKHHIVNFASSDEYTEDERLFKFPDKIPRMRNDELPDTLDIKMEWRGTTISQFKNQWVGHLRKEIAEKINLYCNTNVKICCGSEPRVDKRSEMEIFIKPADLRIPSDYPREDGKGVYVVFSTHGSKNNDLCD